MRKDDVQPPPDDDYEPVNTKVLKAEENPPVVVATQKEVTVLHGLSTGKKPQQAMEAAGYNVSKEVAEVYCGGLSKRYNEDMQQALFRHGITPDTIALLLAEQLAAIRPVVVRGEGVLDYPDNAARQSAARQVLEIWPGGLAPKRHEVDKRSFESIIMRVQMEEDEDE